ncbi:hypothetical protein PMAYCL1PPCAC_14423, partial [Pristionchus mayeri]
GGGEKEEGADGQGEEDEDRTAEKGQGSSSQEILHPHRGRRRTEPVQSLLRGGGHGLPLPARRQDWRQHRQTVQPRLRTEHVHAAHLRGHARHPPAVGRLLRQEGHQGRRGAHLGLRLEPERGEPARTQVQVWRGDVQSRPVVSHAPSSHAPSSITVANRSLPSLPCPLIFNYGASPGPSMHLC